MMTLKAQSFDLKTFGPLCICNSARIPSYIYDSSRNMYVCMYPRVFKTEAQENSGCLLLSRRLSRGLERALGLYTGFYTDF